MVLKDSATGVPSYQLIGNEFTTHTPPPSRKPIIAPGNTKLLSDGEVFVNPRAFRYYILS